MKILHLCLSHGKGGLELYAVKILKWLSDKKYPCHAVAVPGKFFSKQLDQQGVSWATCSPWSHYFPLLSSFRLARLMEREKTDILHLHWGNDLALAVLAKVFSRRPVKLVYTRHMGLSRKKKDLYHDFLYRRVDAFLAITKLIYGQACRNLPMEEETIGLIYHGIPLPPMKNEASLNEFFESSGLRKEAFKIALFGRIEYGKGHDLLVKAVKSLVDKGHDVQTLFVGHCLTEDYLETLRKEISVSGLEERITYFGSHPNPMEIMGCFDVVVLASYQEAFGLVLAEAMRCGTAVVGSDAGGVPEIISDGETGLLFETRNADSLTSALERLIDDPALRKRMAAAGKAFADEKFSDEQHFDRLEEIYKGYL